MVVTPGLTTQRPMPHRSQTAGSCCVDARQLGRRYRALFCLVVCSIIKSMQVTLELPDNLVHSLGVDLSHVQRNVLEAVVAAAVRDATITSAQGRTLLGLSRYEMDGLLKKHRAGYEMTIDELERDTAQALAATT